MNTEQQQKPVLLITQNLLYKIYRLCQVNNPVEWSAVLFYKILDGDVENPTKFKFEANDLFLMDIGSGSYTEYEYDEHVVKYLCDNPHLMGEDYAMGHIHSHNNMSVFFSGTDKQELVDNAPNHNFYLSLIVNNKNNMCAKVAISQEKEITTTSRFKRNGLSKWFTNEPEIKIVNEVVDYDCDIKLLSNTEFENRLNIIKKKVKTKPLNNIRKSQMYGVEFSRNESLHGKYKQLAWEFGENVINNHSQPNTDEFFSKEEIINFTNLLLGNVNASTFDNLQSINKLSDENFNRFMSYTQDTCSEKFLNMFPDQSVKEIQDVLEEVRDEIIDFEDNLLIKDVVLKLILFFDDILIPLYDDTSN